MENRTVAIDLEAKRLELLAGARIPAATMEAMMRYQQVAGLVPAAVMVNTSPVRYSTSANG